MLFYKSNAKLDKKFELEALSSSFFIAENKKF